VSVIARTAILYHKRLNLNEVKAASRCLGWRPSAEKSLREAIGP
jgi:hypothetical protein